VGVGGGGRRGWRGKGEGGCGEENMREGVLRWRTFSSGGGRVSHAHDTHTHTHTHTYSHAQAHTPHATHTHTHHTRTHTHSHTHIHTHTHMHTHTQGTKGASRPSAEDQQYDEVGTAPRYTPSQKGKEEGKGKRKRQK